MITLDTQLMQLNSIQDLKRMISRFHDETNISNFVLYDIFLKKTFRELLEERQGKFDVRDSEFFLVYPTYSSEMATLAKDFSRKFYPKVDKACEEINTILKQLREKQIH